ncbi:hypothetical protein MLD38_027072 [Melastoma candidum]|uniref:Uncharacterized protein n=1 Tax=Melastoma candidum TaxID=119954 RepID=A0ACB9P0K0_9MYRT|nr:hypothetical protein MLD38_027072 [Melastoma candidum]
MDVTEVSMMHHVCIVLFGLWFLSKFSLCHGMVYFVCLVYLFLVHLRHLTRIRREIRFEEKRESNQRRVLTDSETVRWLNHAIEKIWPVCMEQITSQAILLPIVPWFLEKYKPWTAKKAEIQHLYLGRNPPIFTEMRVLQQNSDDDHLVLELGMNFLTADDMSAVLAVQLRKTLGFGMWTKLHMTSMHVEGKVLVGVKFLREWPFIGRLRVCFAEPPYFRMTVKPLFSHGIDVTEVPGIAGWLDNLLSIAFEQTLVEPNMLVVDMEKFVEPQKGNWFSVDVKDPVAHARVEIIEAADMKPSDLNGLADPYVKGQMGPYRFKTKIQRKTLSPKWMEEFKIPIVTWESPNILNLEVYDKDPFMDDYLGKCSVNINDLKDGQRHDMWMALQDIKMGRLHLAISVLEGDDQAGIQEPLNVALGEDKFRDCTPIETPKTGYSSQSSMKSSKAGDRFEPIDIEGQRETGIWIHQPGREVSQTWAPRKGKSRHAEMEIQGEDTTEASNKATGNIEGKQSGNPFQRGLSKIFQRTPRKEDERRSIEVDGEVLPSPHVNLRSINSKKIAINLVVEGDALLDQKDSKEGSSSREESGSDSPGKGKMKDKAKGFFKHADRTIKHVLSRKGSRRSRDSASSVREKNVSSESDCSDNESPPTPGVGTIAIPSTPVTMVDTANSRTPNDNSGVPVNAGDVQKPPGAATTQGIARSGSSSTGTIGSESTREMDRRIITSVIPEDDQLNSNNPKE